MNAHVRAFPRALIVNQDGSSKQDIVGEEDSGDFVGRLLLVGRRLYVGRTDGAAVVG